VTPYLVIALLVIPIAASFSALLTNHIVRLASRRLAALTIFCCASLVAYEITLSGEVVDIVLSGWQVPLGIRLHVDGLSALLLVMTGFIAACITFFAEAYFGKQAQRGRLAFFWPLWFLAWTALNGLFVSGDAFNLYVTLEIINLAAVAMVALPRTEEAVKAALGYLVIAFLGSLSYLFGVAILYTSLGTLDIQLLAHRAVADGPFILAAVLMLIGLMIKTALFPLHFWLPPAHASAPTPVSALLSGLVVTASAYMIVRFGFTVFAPLLTTPVTMLLGLLGALAVVWGSLHAFMQERVKMVIAYSTIAQLGYVFVVFPIVTINPDSVSLVWYGVLYFMVSHACAKAAAFLAAGTLKKALGHDSIAHIGGAAIHWPMVLMAFGLAGVNLIGLPPSGGFIGKWLMLQGAIKAGQWLIVATLIVGSLLAAAYIFRVLRVALRTPEGPPPQAQNIAPLAALALILAMAPLLLGVFSQFPFALLAVGSPFGGAP
jgi:multicomponent Na+:H+ antiporter subunit D